MRTFQRKHLSQQEQDQPKSKIRRTCENYSRIKKPYKYKKTIENLSNNKNIIILKQDKSRGAVILNRKSYIEKCFKILETDQFKKLKIDPTKNNLRKATRNASKYKEHINRKKMQTTISDWLKTRRIL